MKLKLTLFFASLLFTFISEGQIDTTYIAKMKESDYYQKVLGFIPETKTSLTYFYNNPNGEIIDSIKSPDGYWICVVIDSQIENWVRLKSVAFDPGLKSFPKLSNSWIPINEIWINLANDSSSIYLKPNKNSIKQTVGFHRVNLIEINGNWAKIQFESNEKKIIGWIHKEDQCGLPWTTCNY
ncbi:MAG: GW dipeptide domain-containing protein [Saprospiraceae bacterium]|nr:GW dipeptide domain-containing protein [Saprospiraceae bacterium]